MQNEVESDKNIKQLIVTLLDSISQPIVDIQVQKDPCTLSKAFVSHQWRISFQEEKTIFVLFLIVNDQ